MSKRYKNTTDIFSSENSDDCKNKISRNTYVANIIDSNDCEKIKWPTSGYYDGDSFYAYEISESVSGFPTVRLTDVIKDDVDEGYFLSYKACEGIISRSKKRSKPICKNLKEILECHMAEMKKNETKNK